MIVQGAFRLTLTPVSAFAECSCPFCYSSGAVVRLLQVNRRQNVIIATRLVTGTMWINSAAAAVVYCTDIIFSSEL